jgi:ribonuclease H2 subunit B
MVQLLRMKVDVLADPAEFEKFDHLVRGLGRDGLLTPGSDVELIRREWNGGSGLL